MSGRERKVALFADDARQPLNDLIRSCAAEQVFRHAVDEDQMQDERCAAGDAGLPIGFGQDQHKREQNPEPARLAEIGDAFHDGIKPRRAQVVLDPEQNFRFHSPSENILIPL